MLIPIPAIITVPFLAAADPAATVNSIFTPVNYVIFLILLVIGMIMYYQWRWGKTCRENVQVVVVRSDGHGDYELAPQSGGSVTLKNPRNNTVRMWPINRLATIDVPYPGAGLVPSFLQKTIRQVVVDEEDWEPLLNRSPHREKVASPDVVNMIRLLVEEVDGQKNPELVERAIQLTEDISTAPTREMIASPAVLGNLMHEKITEAVITVNKEMLDSVSSLMKRLGKLVSPTMFYIGTGAILVLLVIMAFMTIPKMGQIVDDLDTVKQAIGIPENADK